MDTSILMITFGRFLQFPKERLEVLELVGMLLDVGKTKLPDTILKKNDMLSPEELQCIGIYPVGGAVELNTGQVGIVIAQNLVRRLQPRVMVILDADWKPIHPSAKNPGSCQSAKNWRGRALSDTPDAAQRQASDRLDRPLVCDHAQGWGRKVMTAADPCCQLRTLKA